jgi:hypothetical protein
MNFSIGLVDNKFFIKLDFMDGPYQDFFGLIPESKEYCYQHKKIYQI